MSILYKQLGSDENMFIVFSRIIINYNFNPNKSFQFVYDFASQKVDFILIIINLVIKKTFSAIIVI